MTLKRSGYTGNVFMSFEVYCYDFMISHASISHHVCMFSWSDPMLPNSLQSLIGYLVAGSCRFKIVPQLPSSPVVGSSSWPVTDSWGWSVIQNLSCLYIAEKGKSSAKTRSKASEFGTFCLVGPMSLHLLGHDYYVLGNYSNMPSRWYALRQDEWRTL